MKPIKWWNPFIFTCLTLVNLHPGTCIDVACVSKYCTWVLAHNYIDVLFLVSFVKFALNTTNYESYKLFLPDAFVFLLMHYWCLLFIQSIIVWCRFVLKSARVSNRAILLFCILATLTGSLLSSDWQALGHDPCHDIFSRTAQENRTVYIQQRNTTDSYETTSEYFLVDYDNASIATTLPLLVNSSLSFAEHCKGMSMMDHACYWNPLSRVTNKLCIGCHPACRSEQKSINFIQFCVGISIILFVSQLFLTSVYSVASDYTPKAFQVCYEHN